MSGAACKHFLISGRVQGVGFRISTQHEAQSLGLHGWVRNLPDGRVEILAWGDSRAMQAFETWCRHGPPHARVTDTEITTATPDPSIRGFMIT